MDAAHIFLSLDGEAEICTQEIARGTNDMARFERRVPKQNLEGALKSA
jgi:hypothetical protein